VKHGQVWAVIERVYARKVLSSREEVPTGALARQAMADLLCEGRLFREAGDTAKERLQAWSLYLRLETRGILAGLRSVPSWDTTVESPWAEGPPSLEDWALARFEALGVQSGEELELLSSDDFEVPDLPETARRLLDREFPRRIDVGDAVYRVSYDLAQREVTLEKVAGLRKSPPSLSLLPAFRGMLVRVRDRGRSEVIRGR